MNRLLTQQHILELALASLVTVIGGVLAVVHAPVMDNNALRAWAVIGAVCGSMASVMFTPPTTMAKGAGKWVGSFTTSIAASPYVAKQIFTAISVDEILLTSAGIAFLAWYILRYVQHLAETKLK